MEWRDQAMFMYNMLLIVFLDDNNGFITALGTQVYYSLHYSVLPSLNKVFCQIVNLSHGEH